MANDTNTRPDPDQVIQDIADYVLQDNPEFPDETYETARYCLMDSLGCGILALKYPACTKLLGPWVEGTKVPGGVHVPGTDYVLDPVKAAFDIGAMIRWLDYNDTWLAAEWGHPSDNLGTILSLGYHISKQNLRNGDRPLRIKDIFEAMIMAHEIQGCMALENAFNRVGLDHVILVKLASTAVAMKMLGGNRTQIINAVSQVFVDGQALRTYRHAPNTGPRKSWAAGDACARAVQLAFLTLRGEIGYPSALTAKGWGFYDVLFEGKEFKFQRPYEHYVMDHVLFKISYPAEFHSQTAVEAAIRLHAEIKDRIGEIKKIQLKTHEAAIRIICKDGPLNNPADRDHCLQYMAAVGLIYGELKADHYEDDFAANPQIDQLRAKFEITEDPQYTKDYHDPEKRSIANAMQIEFEDGSKTQEVEIEYPLGHKRRREEGIPVLLNKFEENLNAYYDKGQTREIVKACQDTKRLGDMSVIEFIDLFEKQ